MYWQLEETQRRRAKQLQPMQLRSWIFLGNLRTHLKIHSGKKQTNAINVNLNLYVQMFGGNIWKHRAEKSQTNAIGVTINILIQALWGDIWKDTVKKSQAFAKTQQRKAKQMQPVKLCIILHKNFKYTFENTPIHPIQ